MEKESINTVTAIITMENGKMAKSKEKECSTSKKKMIHTKEDLKTTKNMVREYISFPTEMFMKVILKMG